MLQAAAPATTTVNGATLDTSDLVAIVAEAKQQWATVDLTAQQLVQLEALRVDVADLPGLNLGESSGSRIVVDTNAAGYGWFVDPTPGQNEEYLTRPDGSLQAKAGSDAVGRMDLLTVISHEIGHVLGYTHTDAANGQVELMDAALAAGVREVPAATAAGSFAADAARVTGDLASAAAASSGVSYFDTRSGVFVKADQSVAPTSKNEQDEFMVVNDQGPEMPRHELYELKPADDKRDAVIAPVILPVESESLVTRLKKMAVYISRKK